MAGQSWASVNSPCAQLPLATVVTSAAAADSFAARPIPASMIKSERVGFDMKGHAPQPGNCQMLVSRLQHISSSASSSISSVDAATKGCPVGQQKTEKNPIIYGQILTRTLLQKSSPQLPFDRPVSTVFATEPRILCAQQPAAPIRERSVSPALQSGDNQSFLQIIKSPRQQKVMRQDAVVLTTGPLSSSHPVSPQNNIFRSVSVGLSSDKSFGSPVSTTCSSPDNFLNPSPAVEDSPASVLNTGSPDTREHAAMEADSGYSDNHTDKSTSPEKQISKDAAQNTPSKRKRVRKSRAKIQDPVQKIFVKKTRRVRANDRERTRMHGLNDAMDELRKHLPSDGNAGKLTKIDTLRMASNYIKVLKMILVDFEKGENLAPLSSDIMNTVSNFFAQPAASPDSSGMTSPAHNPGVFEDAHLQNCAAVSTGAMLVSGQFPCYQSSRYPDSSYDVLNNSVASGSGAQHPRSGDIHTHNNGNVTVSVLDVGGGAYGSAPVNTAMPTAGYNNVNSFAPLVGNMFNHQYAVSGQCSSSQDIFHQHSSQCY